MKKSLLLLNLFILGCITSYGTGSKMNAVQNGNASNVQPSALPQSRHCGTMENLAIEIAKDPGLLERMVKAENELQQTIKSMTHSGQNKINTVYKIPVVVHVVYSNGTENVSDAQIYSQIAALNRDYRKQNSDISSVPSAFSGLAADCEIEFCLATQDPNGQATNGITRTFTSNTAGFGNPTPSVKSDATGGKTPWNTSTYMNMWVCNLQGNLLGYAQFPNSGSANTDGIVIDYQYFGTIGTATAPFNLGRTAVHEVGHYLNLRHIWGDATCGDDFVNDTPQQQEDNNGCPSFPHVTCSNGPNGDMFMNYMDYVNDNCMHMFSNGQKSRMVATLTTTRANLLSNTNVQCNAPSQVLTCDTAGNYLSTTSLALYRPSQISQPGTGYISGTNSFGDIGFAEKFNPMLSLQKIYGARIGFGAAYGFASATANVRIWKADGPNGTPGTILATKTIGLQEIVDNINNNEYTDVSFAAPVSLANGAFFLGFDFNPATLDSIAVYTTVDNAVSTGRAYEQYDNGTWFPFTDAVNSWGVNVALAVAPAICIDYTGVEDETKLDADLLHVYPNPSAGIFELESELFKGSDAEIRIYDRTGKLVWREKVEKTSPGTLQLNCSFLADGLYLMNLQTEAGSVSKHISLIR